MELYSCGECPVCHETGDLLVVKNPASGTLFLFCHHCGCAWPSPPPPHVLDHVDPPEKYSPGGFALPTSEEIAGARERGWPARRLDAFDQWWKDILSPNLASH